MLKLIRNNTRVLNTKTGRHTKPKWSFYMTASNRPGEAAFECKQTGEIVFKRCKTL